MLGFTVRNGLACVKCRRLLDIWFGVTYVITERRLATISLTLSRLPRFIYMAVIELLFFFLGGGGGGGGDDGGGGGDDDVGGGGGGGGGGVGGGGWGGW